VAGAPKIFDNETFAYIAAFRQGTFDLETMVPDQPINSKARYLSESARGIQ
jgi:hypothetical protein